MIDFTYYKMAPHRTFTVTCELTYDENLPGKWIGRRGAVVFPQRSLDLALLDFYLWGTLKYVVYPRKPATLAVLWEEMETVCTTIQENTLVSNSP
jgi:hypothetical protein